MLLFRLIPGDIGRPITDLAAHFADGDFEQDIRAVLRTLETRERQLSAPRAQTYQMRILPYRTVNNVIEGVVITFLDVSKIMEAERRAVAAQVYAESIVETVREPLVVLDAGLRVKSANKAFYETFQVFRDDTIGHVIFELSNRQWDIPELRRLLTEILPTKSAFTDYQVEHEFQGLGRRVMLLNARQLEGPKEHDPLILLSIDDITESRQELLRLNADLRHIAYATSHDLQEPLRMVVSYTQLLAREYRGKLDAQADKFIAYAVSGAQRMETLLGNLREYWSVNEHWKNDSKAVDTDKALNKAIQNLDRVIQESGANISQEKLPAVMAEEIPMTLLFQNLIGNAIKYRRAGAPPKIHIGVSKQNGAFQFSVADNGIGIDKQHLDTIFAPFKRLHGTEDYPGSGLGLAIAKKIVERTGGRIWAESDGQGSVFHFTVPAKDGNS